jgi:hydroxybutyrate-dimer hydrolase
MGTLQCLSNVVQAIAKFVGCPRGRGTAGRSKLPYIEVANAQHFDAFLGLPDFAGRLVPLHCYYIQAMDLMYANLKTGAGRPGRAHHAAGLERSSRQSDQRGQCIADESGSRRGRQITFSGNLVTVAE